MRQEPLFRRPLSHANVALTRLAAMLTPLVAVVARARMLSAQSGPLRQFELKAESSRFWDLVTAGTPLEKVAGGFSFTEGPVWDDGGFLYISDEQQNRISRVFPDGRTETVRASRDPDGATLDRRHRLIVCLSTLRAVIAVSPVGSYTTLAGRYEGKKLNSPNDVVLGPVVISFRSDGRTLSLTA